eukprot:COSAG01_NODE_17499_length_1146_cov_0.813754_1_plen_42_part_10
MTISHFPSCRVFVGQGMVEKASGDVSAAREAFAEALRRNARC